MTVGASKRKKKNSCPEFEPGNHVDYWTDALPLSQTYICILAVHGTQALLYSRQLCLSVGDGPILSHVRSETLIHLRLGKEDMWTLMSNFEGCQPVRWLFMFNLCRVSGKSIQFVYNIHERKVGKGGTESLWTNSWCRKMTISTPVKGVKYQHIYKIMGLGGVVIWPSQVLNNDSGAEKSWSVYQIHLFQYNLKVQTNAVSTKPKGPWAYCYFFQF